MIVFDIIVPMQCFVRTLGAFLLFRVDKPIKDSFVFFNFQIRI